MVGLSATWESERNHSVELLPNIERLLGEAGRTKDDIEAVFVDVGPGGYAALRVGVSIAKGIAHGLGVPIVGIGRLELDAYGAASESGATGRIIGVHRAGRGEVAWAAYAGGVDAGWGEVEAPRIEKAAAMRERLARGDCVTGEVDDELAAAAQAAGATVIRSERHRVVALATLGDVRLRAGRIDDATTLVPLYLRAPAIGPQGRAGGG